MKVRPPGAQHVVLDPRAQSMHCENCGATSEPGDGYLTFKLFLAASREWLEIHRKCKPKV